jgi:hypothetical protein
VCCALQRTKLACTEPEWNAGAGYMMYQSVVERDIPVERERGQAAFFMTLWGDLEL